MRIFKGGLFLFCFFFLFFVDCLPHTVYIAQCKLMENMQSTGRMENEKKGN